MAKDHVRVHHCRAFVTVLVQEEPDAGCCSMPTSLGRTSRRGGRSTRAGTVVRGPPRSPGGTRRWTTTA
ncbi:hypothetical protein ACFFX0_17790 [Citricoccus parietis]|uniref:Uncharacterized protein n=1 Tax=Citricoccus parietis TaxID=592307 RepID=A0ABV5G1Z2_9MICC